MTHVFSFLFLKSRRFWGKMAEWSFVRLLLFCYSVSGWVDSAVQENIWAESGNNVTLRCRAETGTSVQSVLWSRTDLDSDVLSFRPNQSDSLHRHLSYKDRVYLLDPELKNGDVSLVLKNLTTADSGSYECRVRNKAHIQIKHKDHICTINLNVSSPGNKDGHKESEGNKDGSGLSTTVVIIIGGLTAVAVAVGVYLAKKRVCPFSCQNRPDPRVNESSHQAEMVQMV